MITQFALFFSGIFLVCKKIKNKKFHCLYWRLEMLPVITRAAVSLHINKYLVVVQLVGMFVWEVKTVTGEENHLCLMCNN